MSSRCSWSTSCLPLRTMEASISDSSSPSLFASSSWEDVEASTWHKCGEKPLATIFSTLSRARLGSASQKLLTAAGVLRKASASTLTASCSKPCIPVAPLPIGGTMSESLTRTLAASAANLSIGLLPAESEPDPNMQQTNLINGSSGDTDRESLGASAIVHMLLLLPAQILAMPLLVELLALGSCSEPDNCNARDRSSAGSNT
mmetsp:Transcript_52743/g.125997  ORF Transcript_52743/g.125997 Transcript_52743/m.125997 type:complete len:203 (+) Transcript_52743:462-1070(+)